MVIKTVRHVQIREYKNKYWLILEVVLLLALLAVFKYFGFLMENINHFFSLELPVPKLVLPIGISFYTFQLISYVVDVYRGQVVAQKSYWKLLLYTSLFHQCIAGPIVRYETVSQEIDERSITYMDLYEGIQRFSIGLAKKTVLANSCAYVADQLLPTELDKLSAQPILGLWLGAVFYTLQIYLDFSAYSDMAIGMGRMVGFHYLENFNYPYIAVSIKDFWRRWHISLSSFFRDYVYIPLGGNRRGTLIHIRNLCIVWILTGFWHGANWNFILWGMFYLCFLLIEKFVFRDKYLWGIGNLYTLLVVVVGWMIFRFEDMKGLSLVLKGMFGCRKIEISNFTIQSIFWEYCILLVISMLACLPLFKKLREWMKKQEEKSLVTGILCVSDMIVPAAYVLFSVCSLAGDSYNPFLYFRF